MTWVKRLDALPVRNRITLWGGGGIGRRRGLKILCSQERVGSTPSRPIFAKAALTYRAAFLLSALESPASFIIRLWQLDSIPLKNLRQGHIITKSLPRIASAYSWIGSQPTRFARYSHAHWSLSCCMNFWRNLATFGAITTRQ